MFGLALTFAALAATASATGYIDGREYVYSYKGNIHTGYPRIKNQYSGYAFHANLIVQPHGDHAILKVDDVKSARFNGEFEDVVHHPHNYGELPEAAKFLTQPFKVFRNHGVVTHFQVAHGEPAFAVNVKRGLIALFNLNFEEPEHAHSTEDNGIQKPDHDGHFYHVYEKGVLGDCETAYIIEHHPHWQTPHNNIVLNVTKLRNYHKCHSAPDQVYGVFHGHECAAADHEKAHTLHGNAQYHYDIRGYRHHYVIEKIVTEGEIAYTPYPIEGQTVATDIHRELELIDERPVTTELHLDGETDDYTSLEYEFDFHKDYKDPVDLKKPHYLFHITGRRVPLDVIKTQFEELTQAYHDETYHDKIRDKEFPAKFLELVKSVATVGYEEIDDLYKAFADIPKVDATDDQKRHRGLFFDTLVALGTNPAIDYATYLIEHKKVRPGEALYYFTQLPAHVKEVSETLLDEIQELCEHESVKQQQNLHIACIFAFSTIIHNNCIARYHPELHMPTEKRFCQPEDVVKYFDYIAKHFEETNDETLKIAYLKAGGIIGLREILPYARPYIEGVGNHSNYFRTTAIWSVFQVGFRFPEKVRDLLVPLLFNQTENYELRLAAYIILMKYRPQLYALEGIVRALHDDPDDQVRSYIYSSLKSLSNSTHPCDRKAAKDAHYALRILEDVREDFDHYDYTYSTDDYVAGYDPEYDFGGSSRLSYFASDTGYVPRALYFGTEDFLGGKNFQNLGIGFKQHGIEKFFDKLFGPEGSFGRRSVFDLFKKRGKRDAAGVEKELNEIKSKINLPIVDYEHIHGEFFMKYMGNHYSFFHFDDHTFEDFFTEGRFQIPNLPALYQKLAHYSYQRFMLTVDKLYIIPSESGIPILFDYKQPIYYHHENHESSFKVEPGFFPEDRAGKWPDHVKVETDGHFAMDKNLFATMGVIIPFDQVIFGAGINRRATVSLPLKLKFDLDVNKKSLNTKWTPVAPHEIYHFKYEPFTFVDSYANSVAKSLEEGYHPVTRLSEKQLHESYLHDALGVGFDVHATYENDFNDEGSWLSFLFEKDYREKFYYLYANPHFEPYHVNVQFSHAPEEATKEVETTITFKSYQTDHTHSEFAEEGFEDFHAIEDRGPFTTCEFIGNLKATGDKERTAHGEIAWTRDLKRSYHKVSAFYDRSPFLHSETEHLKVCAASYLKYPKYDLTKVATLDTLGMDHTVESELKVNFGKDCKSDQKIKIQGHFKTTEEQRDLESRRDEPDTPEHYNPYAHYYHECQKEREHHINYGENCMKYMEYVSTVHEFDFDAKYEHLSPKFLNFTYKLGGFLRHVLYDHADHDTIGVNHPEGELHLRANFSVRLPVVDIRVSKPHSESHYTHVDFPHYHGFSSFPHFEDIHVKNSFSDVHCKLEGDHVTTFDGYEYNLPSIDCYKVLARDCSPGEHFTVLGHKITHPKYQKSVKIFLGKHKVEALPVSDDSDIIIRVDGKRVPVSDNEPYLHYDGDDHSHGPIFYVTHRDFYYALHSEEYGLIVEYDGHAIVVQVSPYYRHKACGLCGNYNGQKHDGLETPEGCYYDDVHAYAYAYAIPSDTCSVPEFHPKCPHEGGFGCTKLRTKVVELASGKVPQTCFSTEPVAECTAHCKARDTTSKKLSFHCLPSKDDSTKALLRQQPHRVIHEVRRKSKDHESEVEVPDVCLKA